MVKIWAYEYRYGLTHIEKKEIQENSIQSFKLVHFHTKYIFNYVSQFTVETYCFADGRCLFKQPQSVICH